jgi:hypothetical protein
MTNAGTVMAGKQETALGTRKVKMLAGRGHFELQRSLRLFNVGVCFDKSLKSLDLGQMLHVRKVSAGYVFECSTDPFPDKDLLGLSYVDVARDKRDILGITLPEYLKLFRDSYVATRTPLDEDLLFQENVGTLCCGSILPDGRSLVAVWDSTSRCICITPIGVDERHVLIGTRRVTILPAASPA